MLRGLPGTDPLSPENRLVLATSIMAGTIVSSSSKLAIVSKSPQTDTISDGSVGGHIGAEHKYAGYDEKSSFFHPKIIFGTIY